MESLQDRGSGRRSASKTPANSVNLRKLSEDLVGSDSNQSGPMINRGMRNKLLKPNENAKVIRRIGLSGSGRRQINRRMDEVLVDTEVYFELIY